ncbi:hypothetical protein EDD29_6395 [Actinocorallia herbida]|uniref:Uncharacterized protein n=2 Tax=Actinocorallia herbida TaxID=58109 RepID=A0A3N1D5A7_9ACTN|nr:hypothetical protein EDD29_6395 [Actinocorallia herbida]
MGTKRVRIAVAAGVVALGITGTGVYLGTQHALPGQEGPAKADALLAPDDGEGIVPTPPETTPTAEAVTPQATDLRETRLPSTSPKADGTSNDGCDPAYGEPTQCVPWVFPDGITAYSDKCLWLKINGFGEVRVVGTDRQRLDPDKNKIACD